MAKKAAELEAAYRERLRDWASLKIEPRPCQYVSTLQSQPSGLSVVFDCPSPGGGDLFEAVRVVQSWGRWRVVLGDGGMPGK